MKKIVIHSLLLLALASGALAHEHFGAGVSDTNGNNAPDAGEPLRLANPPAKGTFFHLLMRPAGQRYAGYYSLDEQPRAQYPNDYFTFTALSDGQTQPDGPLHAATGATIWMEITSVTGPAGGSLGFWDIDPSNPDLGWSYTHTTPTVSFVANEPTGGYKFVLSEPLELPAGPGEDPYGHIHNRGFTVDTPGVYVVGFTLRDESTNGPAAGPIHVPSQTYYFTFVAGVPDPTPTPAPPPAPTMEKPAVRIAGASKRTVSRARLVLRGTAQAPAGLSAVQIKTQGAFRSISRQDSWKTTVRLKRGNNLVQARALDALGRFSTVQKVQIRRR